MDDDDREYLNYVSKAIHERHYEETWRQIQELFRRVTAQPTDLRQSREQKSSTRSDQCDHALARQINTYAGRTQLKCRRTRIQRLQPFADVIAEHVDGDTSEVRRVTLEPRQGSF